MVVYDGIKFNMPEGPLVIVEDNPADMTHYLRLLEDVEHGFDHIECIATAEEAAERLRQAPTPACCLLDFHLPDGSALSLIEENAQSFDGVPCPIVVITGQENTHDAVELLKKGVQDYINKNDLNSEMLIRIIQNSSQTWYLEKQVKQLALYDSLTKLANRGLFIDRIKRYYDECNRYNRNFALLLVDLDNFKDINDRYGHDAGDTVLEEVSRRITECIRKTDTAARLGGDEFAIILEDLSEESAHRVTKKLVTSLTFGLDVKSYRINVTPSIGLTCFPSAAQSYQELMREADVALYRAKQNGRGQFAAFTKDLEIETQRINLLMDSIKNAILSNQLEIAYQPIYDKELNVNAVEALVRWQFNGEWVSPEKIIEIVTSSRLEDIFHRWLFETSINTLLNWKSKNPSLKLHLNLPANACHNVAISEVLKRTVADLSLDPSDIVLEVTETHLMTHPDQSKCVLDSMAQEGFEISIDDFGTGYSTMKYLAELPCKSLKIDKGFFLKLESNPKNRQIIRGIVGLAKSLELSIVAEGIESEKQKAFAHELDCDLLQGYLTGTPIIANRKTDYFQFLEKSQSLTQDTRKRA